MKKSLLAPDDLSQHAAAGIGGKAAGLLRLHRIGAPVPPWRVLRAGLTECPEDELDTAFAELGQPPFNGIAVRSSALNEDGAQRSHAGVYESVFIGQHDQLADAIARVIASGARPGARDYAPGSGEDCIAVILQARVSAVCSGMLFSADPARADPALRYVEAVNGAGHQLADATHDPTRVYLDVADGSCMEIVQGSDGPEELNEQILQALHVWAARVEDDHDCAMDIEWAWDGATLWLLQARPITALNAHPERLPDEPHTSWFFDQRFNEPIRPLTRDTLLQVIADVALGDALRMRRCPVPDTLLFFYAGQAYAPCRFYEMMLRGAPRWFLSTDLRQALRARAPINPIATLRYALHAGISLWKDRADAVRNLRAWDKFHSEIPALLAEIDQLPEETQADWCARWGHYDRLTRRFLQIHRWSILWADYWFRGYGFAKKALPRRVRDALDARLRADLRLPTVAANQALENALRDSSPENVRHLVEYFGHRSPSLDYATPTWAELWEAGQLAPRKRADQTDQTDPTDPADQKAGRGEGNRCGSRILFPLRRFLELREEQRFTWERVLAAQRRMILRVGDHLATEKLLDTRDQVFFLQRAELLVARFHGARVPPEIVRRRIRSHRLDRVTVAPPVIGVSQAVRDVVGSVLTGIGASPGIVTGSVHILRAQDPYFLDLPDGVILVARALDPAWTPHLLRARGVILERGGLLSHAAVLAREYRTPLIVGLDNATNLLRQGDIVTLDGSRGTVQTP